MQPDIQCPDRMLASFTPAESQTYDRLNDYNFDRPDAALPFSQRLAKENRWSRDYTDRAIREYKRFAFLAVVAGHPVSPSDQVDQVWHLHLTYTRSYWQEFCDEILAMPLHHEPTQGGAAERSKHHDWYQATLESYDRIFGPLQFGLVQQTNMPDSIPNSIGSYLNPKSFRTSHWQNWRNPHNHCHAYIPVP
jgi:hypothetical protein